MTILLYNDGRLVIDDGNPIEGNSLDGLVACVSDPQSGDTLKFDGKQWVAGAAASGLPTVSGDDNGKVLTVVEGEWAPAAAGGGGGLVVTLTAVKEGSTVVEYNCDKTAGEILAALQSGIVVPVHFPDDEYTENVYGYVATFACNFGSPGWITVGISGTNNFFSFVCDTLNDYPHYVFDD